MYMLMMSEVSTFVEKLQLVILAMLTYRDSELSVGF